MQRIDFVGLWHDRKKEFVHRARVIRSIYRHRRGRKPSKVARWEPFDDGDKLKTLTVASFVAMEEEMNVFWNEL